MSRSYKKTGAYAITGGSDKWNRTRYHRDERRKVSRLLKEQEHYGTAIWEPVTETCSLDGDVCYVDDWWYSDPSEYIINYDETVLPNTYSIHPDCFMCGWAYCKDGKELVDPEEEPWENIVLNKVDRTLGSADKYGWATDGGAYWRDDKSEIRKEFDEGVFGIKTWTYRRCVFRDGPRNIWDEYCENRDAKYNKKHPMMVVCCYYKKPMEKPSTHTNLDEFFSWNWNHEELHRWSVKLPYRRDHWFDPSILPEGAYDVHVYKSRGPSSLRSPKWDVISYALSLAPNSLWGPKDLVEWLRAHEEEIIEGMFKRRFGK